MSKRSRIAVLGLVLGLLLAPLIGAVLAPREPVYQGKRLTEWLRVLDSTSILPSQGRAGLISRVTPEYQQAEEAIRAIGTNGHPTLLRLLRARDGTLKDRVIRWSRKQSLLRLRWETTEKQQTLALKGLWILGTDGAPVLLEVLKREDTPAHVRSWCLKLVDQFLPLVSHTVVPHLGWPFESFDPQEKIATLRAIALLGPINPWPALSAALTNSDPRLRSSTLAAAIARLEEPTRTTVRTVIEGLNDPSRDVRAAANDALLQWVPNLLLRSLLVLQHGDVAARGGAAWSLGHAGQSPEVCVPVLTQCLRDSNTGVRVAAAEALGKFARDARAAVPELTVLLKDPSGWVRLAVTNALRRIQPNTTLPRDE
jgi:HEAT repeat protein